MSEGLPPLFAGRPPVTIDHDVLDRVPWAAEVGPRQLLAAHLTIRSQDATLGRFLDAYLEAFPSAPQGTTALDVVQIGGHWSAYRDGGRSLSAPSIPEMARALVWAMNSLALETPATDVHVHAAVTSLEGRAIVLPGASGAGKTTLAAALTLGGWSYLSDEVAAIGLDGAVVRPYPRPLALEPGSFDLVPGALRRWPANVPQLMTDLHLVLPSTLGTTAPPMAAPIAAIVFPEVVTGGSTFLERMSRAEALERLTSLTFNLRFLGRAGFEGLVNAVRLSSCHRLVLDGVAAAPTVLESLLDRLFRDCAQ